MSQEMWGIVWLVVLLAANAFFVGAEFAVISARRSQIEPIAEAGSRSARTTLWAMENATLMLATAQLGITVCSLLILNVSEPAFTRLLLLPLSVFALPVEVARAIAFVISLLFVSFLHVVFGEMVPKNISFSVPDRAALLLVPPLAALARLFAPLVWALNALANRFLLLMRVQPKNEATSVFTAEEVALIVRTSTREGVLRDTTGALGKALDFSRKKVQDVMVSITELVTLPEDASAARVESAAREYGFSRYVLLNDRGEPSGYLHVKDVIDLDGEEYLEPVPPKRIRTLISLYRGTELEDALQMLRRSGAHLARVFAESGETLGVIFLEDIIEELVGEVQDATRR